MRTLVSHHLLWTILAGALALPVFFAGAGEMAVTSGQKQAQGEKLFHLRSGEAGLISYGLYAVVSTSHTASNAPAGSDLILIVRNNGAKSITMEDVTAANFSLRDVHGKDAKLYLWSKPRTMGYGDSTVIHLLVDHAAVVAQPWHLRFKSRAGAFVPFDVLIPDIALPQTRKSDESLDH